jgi:hypothetical protein
VVEAETGAAPSNMIHNMHTASLMITTGSNSVKVISALASSLRNYLSTNSLLESPNTAKFISQIPRLILSLRPPVEDLTERGGGRDQGSSIKYDSQHATFSSTAC